MNVLLVRMDRLGDLICTLPVDQHPILLNPDSKTMWLVSKGLETILRFSNPTRNCFASELAFSWSNLTLLINAIRSQKYDKVILFYAPWWVGLACRLAGIPDRYSPRSRWYQFFFFNHTLKQSRSRSDKHEAEYNWDLVNWALSTQETSQLTLPFLELKSESTPKIALPQNYVVIHPGMGGSALNWPPQHYLDLAKTLSHRGQSIVITGTVADLPWLKDIEVSLKQIPNVHWKVGEYDIPTLINVLANSIATIAPSTGVLHVAASTGVKTIGIYSPIKVQTPKRWAPRGKQIKTLTPQVECEARTKCLGETCKHFPCLHKITPEQVIKELSL